MIFESNLIIECYYTISFRPRGRPPKKVRISEEDSETSSSVSISDNDDLMDVSEENNRMEGAGGNDFHYYCKICQISFFKYTAFKHHMFSSLELHKQQKKKKKMEKEAEMEYECSDCCIAFQDRKSHQAHMIEEHKVAAGPHLKVVPSCRSWFEPVSRQIVAFIALQ